MATTYINQCEPKLSKANKDRDQTNVEGADIFKVAHLSSIMRGWGIPTIHTHTKGTSIFVG